MIHFIEQQLIAVLTNTLYSKGDVLLSSAHRAIDNINISISVRDMNVVYPDNPGGIKATRTKSNCFKLYPIVTDGVSKEFAVQVSDGMHIVEIESPPGVLLKRGDDYYLDGTSILFYSPPSAGNPGIIVRLQGEETDGYCERRPCTVSITLQSSTDSADKSENQLYEALDVLLSWINSISVLNPDTTSGNLSMRLADPVASLTQMSNAKESDGTTTAHISKAQISLSGYLEIMLSKNIGKKQSIIKQIKNATKVIKLPSI